MQSRYIRRALIGAWILLLIVVGLWWFESRVDSTARAAPRISWTTLTLTPAVTGLNQPTEITHAGDGSGRLFIVERAGRIRIFKSGALYAAPFLDITSRVNSGSSERGLLGLAFPPAYASKGVFYVYYTDANGALVIARYRVSANPDIADASSEQIILRIAHPTYSNHNGGQLKFGLDGFLYIGTGDGGGGGDPFNNAQNPASLLGKILRVNVEPPGSSLAEATPVPSAFQSFLPIISKSSSSDFTYSIPVTNPFTQTLGYRGEIWALGLRNPWRFSFDRATGDLYIADVGQNAWEEVDFQAASSAGGENYGWRCYEGNHAYNTTGCLPQSSYVAAVAEYDHGQGCSITGGYVYRGAIAAMQGIYFYGDLCTRKLWGLQYDNATSSWQTNLFTTTVPSSISTFGEDQAGNLYVTGYGDGVIYQITSP